MNSISIELIITLDNNLTQGIYCTKTDTVYNF